MASSAATYRRLDRHIYIDERSGAVRIRVYLHPLPASTRTFDTLRAGIDWAYAERALLLERRATGRASQGSPQAGTAGVATAPIRPSPASKTPAPATASAPDCPAHGTQALTGLRAVSMATILDDYARHEAQRLACPSEATTRIRRLASWFGQHALGQLSRAFLGQWLAARLAGRLGSGRGPLRDEAPAGVPVATKDQLHRARLSGRTAPASQPPVVYPVSTQTARHELGILRRAVACYVERQEADEADRAWVKVHPLMTMPLPAQAEPRDTRLSTDELRRILGAMESECAPCAIMFAVATTLRRAELLSLRWEDLDLGRRVIRLRRPVAAAPDAEGSEPAPPKKSKTHERDVPLTDLAIRILEKVGIQADGRIFPISGSGLSQAFRRAADRAGVPGARLHDCRREAVSLLVDELGLSVGELMQFTGHRDPAVLIKHYLRPSASRLASRLAGRSTTTLDEVGL